MFHSNVFDSYKKLYVFVKRVTKSFSMVLVVSRKKCNHFPSREKFFLHVKGFSFT